MIRRMRESNDNVFYCAECTYDKSNGTMFLYTTDITEVRGSVKPKDSMKVEGGFLVRRKYFRSEYEAQEYIDSLPNAMPMSRNESIRRSNKSMMIRKVNKLMEGNVYFDNDDLVFTVLEKYLSPRDASWLQRNKQGLCKGDKVFIGEHILGLIAHEYAIHKFGPYVANNVGSVASYFSVMKPLTIDIKTGRVTLPQCYLAASNLSRELKKQYNQLTWQLDEVFRDIAEEILVILDEDPIDRGEEIPYEYESIRRNRYRGLREGDASLKTNYAVAVRDMHTAHIHLLTGTKSECESLIGSLETADDYMNDDYVDEYEKDEYIQTLYDEVLSQYNWINDINYREIDNRNNYYDPDSGKYYHILNKNWFDLYI